MSKLKELLDQVVAKCGLCAHGSDGNGPMCDCLQYMASLLPTHDAEVRREALQEAQRVMRYRHGPWAERNMEAIIRGWDGLDEDAREALLEVARVEVQAENGAGDANQALEQESEIKRHTPPFLCELRAVRIGGTKAAGCPDQGGRWGASVLPTAP